MIIFYGGYKTCKHFLRSCILTMAIQTTFLMVKPDGVKRQLVGDIVDRFERKGFELKGAKLMQVTEELAKNTTQNMLNVHSSVN